MEVDVVLVGLYVPAATQISSPKEELPKADCKSLKASVQDNPVLAPVALILTYQRAEKELKPVNRIRKVKMFFMGIRFLERKYLKT
jgi:hypothetical protein